MKKINVLLLNFGVENKIQPWIEKDILYALYTAENIEEVEKYHKACRFDLIFLKISKTRKENSYPLRYFKNIYPRSRIVVISEKPSFREAFQYSICGADNFRATFRDFFEFINFLRCSSPRAIVDNIKDKFMNVFQKNDVMLLLMAVTETALACLVKTKGEYETTDHMEGVAQYARLICEKLWEEKGHNQISNQRYKEYVYFGSRLHDIGKISISEKITMKPYSLTKKEFDIMKTHTRYGHEMLSTIEQSMGYDLEEFINVAKEIALYHHENYNGTGYPCGLKGKDIPLSARICALADTYDAVTSDRRYRKAFSQKQAQDIILHKEDHRYDPDILKIFRRHNREFMEICSVLKENAETYSHKKMRVQCAWCKSLFISGKWLPCNEILYATHVMCPACHKKLRKKIANINH